jgi:hypothetical protein
VFGAVEEVAIGAPLPLVVVSTGAWSPDGVDEGAVGVLGVLGVLGV